MRVLVRTFAALATVSALACHEPSTDPVQAPDFSLTVTPGSDGVALYAEGRGAIDLSAVAGATDSKFWFGAQKKADGRVSGFFGQRRARNGLVIDFEGRVTCLTVDATLGRARIAGVITANRSTDPAFLTENHEVGDDVWFRVQDGRAADGSVDASTTYGFKPTLVNTSAEYCALPFTGLPQWNPASTFPLRSGGVQVLP